MSCGCTSEERKTEKALETATNISRYLWDCAQRLDDGEDIRPLEHNEVRNARQDLLKKEVEFSKDMRGKHDFYDRAKVWDVAAAIDVFEQYISESVKLRKEGARGDRPEINLMGEARMIMGAFLSDPRKYVCSDIYEPRTEVRAA